MGSSFLCFPDLPSWSTARKSALDVQQTHCFFSLVHVWDRVSVLFTVFYSLLAEWLTLVRQPTQRRCKTAFCRDCWMDITLAMWDTNAKTQFQAQVPSMTVPQFALPGSAKVSGYFITAVVSTALWKYWPILQLKENKAQREEKLAYAVSGESSSNPVYTAAMGTRPSKVLWEQGKDALFLHPLLRQLQDTQGEGTMAHITLLTGRCRCSHRQPVIAWDWEQPHQLCPAVQSFPSPRLPALHREERMSPTNPW